MVTTLRLATLSLLLAVVAPLASHAQTADVASGFLFVGFEQHFVTKLRDLGIKPQLINYDRPDGTTGFQVRSGEIDLTSGQGEIQSKGLIKYKQSGMDLDTSLLELDTTGTSTVVTAVVTMNNVVVGRQVIYRIINNPPDVLLPINGVIDSGTLRFMMDPAFWTEFSTFFQIASFTPGPMSGDLRITATLGEGPALPPTITSLY